VLCCVGSSSGSGSNVAAATGTGSYVTFVYRKVTCLLSVYILLHLFSVVSFSTTDELTFVISHLAYFSCSCVSLVDKVINVTCSEM
jgi:hypothetical protein